MKKNKNIIIAIVVVLVLIILGIGGYFLYMRMNYISKDEVKRIVLNDTKLDSSDVIFGEIDLDTDDGVSKYDVEFHYNRHEYNYEIDAKDGKIISSDFVNTNTSNNNTTTENNSSNTNTNNSTTNNNYISEQEARDIAIKDASVNEKDIVFTDVDLDLENNKAIYEVDFHDQTTEYEYKIDGINKSIINKKSEPRD